MTATDQHLENNLFPIFVKLREIETLVVGGGNVGLEKVEALLKNDPLAQITIVAPWIKPELATLVRDKASIKILQRTFDWPDLNHKKMVILATDDRELHVRIKEQTQGMPLLVNVADTPDLCDFYLGSTVKKGALKVGISTNGQSPTLAKRIRELLEDVLPDDVPSLLKNLKSIRDRLKGDFEYKVNTLNNITTKLLEDEHSFGK
ncbi:MAG: bifunctional precorrin-2 dehydrogenase/sirohydrochlorin ferrochelatase [Bacteroidota bacterium]